MNLTIGSPKERGFYPSLCFPRLIEIVHLNWGSLKTSPLVLRYVTPSFCVTDHPHIRQKEVTTTFPIAGVGVGADWTCSSGPAQSVGGSLDVGCLVLSEFLYLSVLPAPVQGQCYED